MALRHHKLTQKETDAQYVLQKVQPAVAGLDGWIQYQEEEEAGVLYSLFAAGLTHQDTQGIFCWAGRPRWAQVSSMGLAGERFLMMERLRGRGTPLSRGISTGFCHGPGQACSHHASLS